MKYLLIAILFFISPILKGQLIADTTLYISNLGDTIKIVNYRSAGTTTTPTTSRLSDSMAVARGLIALKQNIIGYTPYNATNPSGYISSITGLNGSSLTGITTSQIAASANKNFVTDAQAVIIGNTSGANTGDNATNTQYSGLAASKQNVLVSATNIKTINGSTVLGSGDLVVSAVAATSTSGVAATATASGTTTITHNLGRTPTIIRIYSISSFTSNAAATPVPFSTGTWNSTGNRCLYMVINGTTTQVSQTSSVFSIIMVTSAGNNITGVIGNVTPTGFDITWSETGTHTAGNFLWEAQ